MRKALFPVKLTKLAARARSLALKPLTVTRKGVDTGSVAVVDDPAEIVLVRVGMSIVEDEVSSLVPSLDDNEKGKDALADESTGSLSTGLDVDSVNIGEMPIWLSPLVLGALGKEAEVVELVMLPKITVDVQ